MVGVTKVNMDRAEVMVRAWVVDLHHGRECMMMFLSQMFLLEVELVEAFRAIVVEATGVRHLHRLVLKVPLQQMRQQDRRMLESPVRTIEVVVGEVTVVSIHMLGDEGVSTSEL